MPPKQRILSVEEHSRNSAGMTYVYPVVSRRARGVSIGINLNPNNACNWQCVYCQVPGLVRGGPPPLDMALLRNELDIFLNEISSGHFMHEQVAPGSQVLQDVAFSGNGEPTTAIEFSQAVDVVMDMLRKHSLLGKIKLRLITNGSQVDKAAVKNGLRKLATGNGEVWFKLDAANVGGLAKINGVRISPDAHLRRLRLCADLCPTWVQSCFFMRNGEPPTAMEIDAYITAVEQVADVVAGVHLYGLARLSMQPEANLLGRLPKAWFDLLADRLKIMGLEVTINP